METKEQYLDYEIMSLDMKSLKTEVEKCLIEENEDYLNELFIYGCWADESELVNKDEDAISKAISLLHRETFTICDAIRKNCSIKVIKKFLDCGTNPNLQNKWGFTPLMFAVQYKHSQAVQELLKRPDIDPNLKNRYGYTALMLAAIEGHTQAVQEILNHPKTDPNLKNEYDQTALMYAAIWGRTQAVQELLKHPKTNPNLQDNEGQTALMIAAERGKTQAVQELLKHPDTNPNLKSRYSLTVLMLATKFGHTQAVQELLKHPAIDVTLINKKGKTAWGFAKTQMRKQFPQLNPIQRIKKFIT